MKNNTKFQTVFIAVVALLVGIIIGIFIGNPIINNQDIAGTIGKVDRYRNVKVTDDDILLRNELIDDSLKRSQYEKYLAYYYYQALRTSNDLERVISKTSAVPEFNQNFQAYSEGLTSYSTYLKTAQLDILSALNMIISLEDNQEIPVIGYLNLAQNAIVRINNHESFLLNYSDDIAGFIEANPESDFPELKDAYDILSINLIQSAILTQNKPMLSYFNKTRLMNNKEGVKVLMSDASFNSAMKDQLSQDSEKLCTFDAEKLGDIDFPIIADSEKLQGFVITSMEKLNVILDAEKIGFVYDAEQMGDVFFDTEQLGVIINSSEQLGAIISDAENLGVYTDMEKLGAGSMNILR